MQGLALRVLGSRKEWTSSSGPWEDPEGFEARASWPPLPWGGVYLMASSLPAWQGLLWGTRWQGPCGPLRPPWLSTASPSSAWASTGARTAPPSCTSSTQLCRGEPTPWRQEPREPQIPDLPPSSSSLASEAGKKGALWLGSEREVARATSQFHSPTIFIGHLTHAWP